MITTQYHTKENKVESQLNLYVQLYLHYNTVRDGNAEARTSNPILRVKHLLRVTPLLKEQTTPSEANWHEVWQCRLDEQRLLDFSRKTIGPLPRIMPAFCCYSLVTCLELWFRVSFEAEAQDDTKNRVHWSGSRKASTVWIQRTLNEAEYYRLWRYV